MILIQDLVDVAQNIAKLSEALRNDVVRARRVSRPMIKLATRQNIVREWMYIDCTASGLKFRIGGPAYWSPYRLSRPLRLEE